MVRLVNRVLNSIDRDPMPHEIGRPVSRNNLDGSFLNLNYPDYGLPASKAYVTGHAPWVFLGVDFTEPFDYLSLPLPHTYRRLEALRFWLTVSRKRAKGDGNTFPGHLYGLHTRVNNLRRCRGRTRRREVQEEVEAMTSFANAEDIINRMQIRTLSPHTLTNDRNMILFLYDAPLGTYTDRRYEEEDTLWNLASYGWTITTTLVTAAAVDRARLFPSMHVFDGHAWEHHRDYLAQFTVQAPAGEPWQPATLPPQIPPPTEQAPPPSSQMPAASVIATEPLPGPSSQPPATPAPVTHPTPPPVEPPTQVGSAPTEDNDTGSLTDADMEVDTDTGALTESYLDPEQAQGALGVIKWAPVAKQHLPNLPLSLRRAPAGAEVWAEHQIWLDKDGTIITQSPLPSSAVVFRHPQGHADEPPTMPVLLGQARDPTVRARYEAAHSRWWTMINPETERYEKEVAEVALYYLFRLPVELVFHILRLSCVSQWHLMQISQVASATRSKNTSIFSRGIFHALGPLFFEPAWSRGSVGVRGVLPRDGDTDFTSPHAQAVAIRDAFVLPKPCMSIYKEHQSLLDNDWSGAIEAAINLLGTYELAAAEPHRWYRDVPQDVQRYFEQVEDVLRALMKMTHLEKLDLRLGPWAINKFPEPLPVVYEKADLYRLVQATPSLRYLSFILDMRVWPKTIYVPTPPLRLESLLGHPDSGTRRAKPKIEYVRVIAPSACVSISPNAVLSCIIELNTFELVCHSVEAPVFPHELVHLIGSHSTDVEAIRMVVIADEDSLAPKRAKDPKPMHQSSGVDEWGFTDESSDLQVLMDVDGVMMVKADYYAQLSAEQYTAEQFDRPLRLPRLRLFHLECTSVPKDFVLNLDLPNVSIFILRTMVPWFGQRMKMNPTPFRRLQYGAMGPFPNKEVAVAAYGYITGGQHWRPLLDGNFKLHGPNMFPYSNFEEASETYNADKWLDRSFGHPVSSSNQAHGYGGQNRGRGGQNRGRGDRGRGGQNRGRGDRGRGGQNRGRGDSDHHTSGGYGYQPTHGTTSAPRASRDDRDRHDSQRYRGRDASPPRRDPGPSSWRADYSRQDRGGFRR
ncbi:hypothetical protein CF319_g6122 [Tilletia indica]|uniref:Uncharacterized protein n=1 Tax=Tilletia indica TaxID=43049 RepID=A0A177T4W6_9BASI|nr:hypothetical protein CF319_g6122 [Tilletia indica]KAE8241746.1 hypothetical protein A4X13_0g7282 [Tilletia indica]